MANLHAAAINAAGRLWHTTRFADGTGEPFGDVQAQTGEIGTLSRVAVAAIGPALHLAAINATTGKLMHTTRFADGTWEPFGEIEAQAGEFGNPAQVAVAAIGPALHLASINAAGRLWHTTRFADGTWEPAGDVQAQAGAIGNPTQVAVAAVGPALHLAAIDAAGRLWHTTRFADGTWEPFGDVEAQAGEIGNLRAVAISAT